MGMFDKVSNLAKTEDFDVTQPFTLYDGKFKGVTVSREYGQNVYAEVVAGPASGKFEDAKTYNVYGVLAEMIQRSEPSEFPMAVKIGRDGQANVFLPA